jgi:hypothetical protein
MREMHRIIFAGYVRIGGDLYIVASIAEQPCKGRQRRGQQRPATTGQQRRARRNNDGDN